MTFPSAYKRKKGYENGVLTEDVLLTSLSAAAVFVSGSRFRGNIIWKTADKVILCFGRMRCTGTWSHDHELACRQSGGQDHYFLMRFTASCVLPTRKLHLMTSWESDGRNGWQIEPLNIDPCSGHILVYAFDVLMAIYAECGYSQKHATRLII